MILPDTNIGRLILDNMSTEKTANLKPDNTPSIEEARNISSGLAKVASIPYKEETFDSLQEIIKIASKCIGDLVDSLEGTNSRNSELEKVSEVRILIDDMANFGHVDEHSIEEKVAELMDKSEEELSIVKEAMKMVGSGKQGNVFFELEKDAGVPSEKGGMFDSVI